MRMRGCYQWRHGQGAAACGRAMLCGAGAALDAISKINHAGNAVVLLAKVSGERKMPVLQVPTAVERRRSHCLSAHSGRTRRLLIGFRLPNRCIDNNTAGCLCDSDGGAGIHGTGKMQQPRQACERSVDSVRHSASINGLVEHSFFQDLEPDAPTGRPAVAAVVALLAAAASGAGHERHAHCCTRARAHHAHTRLQSHIHGSHCWNGENRWQSCKWSR